MGLDIRIPIGLLFLILGGLLVLFGLTSDSAIYARSLNINVNLWWGLPLALFGGLMFLFGARAAPRRPTP